MKVNLYERLTLPSYLPQQAGIVEATLIADIKKKLTISQKDIEDAGIKSELQGDKVMTRWANNIETDIEFSEGELSVIKKALQKLDTDGKIETTSDFVAMYKKFV